MSIAAGLPYNIHEMSITDLMACGVKRVSLPMVAILSAIQAISGALASVRDSQGFEGVRRGNLICSSEDVSRLLALHSRSS